MRDELVKKSLGHQHQWIKHEIQYTYRLVNLK